jgi:hypothetical protein
VSGIFCIEESLYRTRSCRDKPRLAKRDAPGQDTGRSQGHLRSCLLGAPGERHQASCKIDRQWCDTPVRELFHEEALEVRFLERVFAGAKIE